MRDGSHPKHRGDRRVGKRLDRISRGLAAVARRYTPDAFVIAVLLTVLTFCLALLLGKSGPLECVRHWGNGFWTLLTFGMQMSLVVFSGYLLAVSPPVRRLLDAAASVPRSPRGAVALLAFASVVLCWLNWGVGLIASAMMVSSFARRHPDADYRLLVAVAYLGMGCSWHMGPSGSVPLLLATPGHFLESTTGILPLTRTVFRTWPLLTVATVSAVLIAVAAMLLPASENRVRVAPEQIPQDDLDAAAPADGAPSTPAARLEGSRIVNLALALPGLLWIADRFRTSGLSLTLDTVNFCVLMLAVLLHPSPRALLRSARQAGTLLHGIVLQFPLYAGMYGLIKDSGLASSISEAFVSLATPRTFPVIIFWYSSILNYFVPSGGSKWVIEAPYLLEAASQLGVDTGKLAVSYAFGDMGTNLIQPFWALPLLAVAKLDFKDILGFELIFCAVYVVLVSAALVLW
ncbi:MAG: TIGR00366 family protein [bacterium]